MVTDSGKIPVPIGRRVRGLTGTAHSDIETWPTPDEGALPISKLTEYLRRKNGVKMYLDGQPEKSIQKACGLGLKQIYRLIRERCLEVHSDGLIFGMRGLVPNLHIKPYKRKRKVKVNVFGHGAAAAMLRTIKMALSAWHPRKLAFSSEIVYREGAGFPSSNLPKFLRACWHETSIEAFFKNLASRGFQKLSNTTGGKSSDKKGRDPDAVAIKSQFQIEYAIAVAFWHLT